MFFRQGYCQNNLLPDPKAHKCLANLKTTFGLEMGFSLNSSPEGHFSTATSNVTKSLMGRKESPSWEPKATENDVVEALFQELN